MAAETWIERTASQRLDIESALYRINKRFELLVARAAASDGRDVDRIYWFINQDLEYAKNLLNALRAYSEEDPCATNSKPAS